MTIVTSLGYLAAAASMASFVPQAWKIIRSGHTKDISVGTYILTVSAFALWLSYGFLQQQWPLVLSNGITAMENALVRKLEGYSAKERAGRIMDDVGQTLTAMFRRPLAGDRLGNFVGGIFRRG